tara:strand:- start:135 stop:677 length:543 start_codon:yes stop_codon:yes gene_type:complete
MISKKIIGGLMILILALSMQSCAFLEGLFKDTVVTTIDNVKPDQRHTIVPADFGLLDEGTREKFRKSGKTPVIVDKSAVINEFDAVDLTDPGDGMFESLAGLGLDLAGTVFPGVAALEGVGLLLSRRKRKHYGKAIKAVAPVNGKVEVKDALVSMASALGLAHSSEGSKEVFETDEEEEE